MADQSEQPNWGYVALGGLLVLWLGLVLYFYLPGSQGPTAAELEQTALTGPADQREMATLKLSSLHEAGREPLRRVLKTTTDPLVRAAALDGLCSLWDYDSMDAMVAGLTDESEVVRRKSHLVVQRMMQLNLAYNPSDPPALRTPVAAKIGDEWKKMKASPVFPGWKKEALEKAAKEAATSAH